MHCSDMHSKCNKLVETKFFSVFLNKILQTLCGWEGDRVSTQSSAPKLLLVHKESNRLTLGDYKM